MPLMHEAMPPAELDSAMVRSRAELRALGKYCRKAVPRSAHAQWRPAADRPDVVSILEASNRGRVPDLVRLRHERMLASPFAFFRGLPSAMAFDLSRTPASGLRVQCCGDCHIENFGIFATPERNIIFDINDFDETLPGPWEWDVKRLATSVFIAARMRAAGDEECKDIVRAIIETYRKQVAECAEMTAISVWYSRIDAREFVGDIDLTALLNTTFDPEQPAPLGQHVRVAKKFTVGDGAERRIREAPPELYHSTSEDEVIAGARQLFDRYRVSLRDDVELLLRRYALVDVAVKVVGIGSVGTRCAVALLLAAGDDPLVLQIKEARESILEAYLPKSRYDAHGQRIVVGQQLLQAASDMFLGWSFTDDGHEYYVRQLKDMKASIDSEQMSLAELQQYASLCAKALAIAHSRSGEPASIAGYLGKSDAFAESIAYFAHAYAEQVEEDYAAFKEAMQTHRLLGSPLTPAGGY